MQEITIAIHHRSGSFSDRWIKYCQENQIPFRIVNAYDSDIIEQVRDCTGFMWHWHHNNYKEQLFARQLTYSLESIGVNVWPDSNTAWHFDDKVGQKYLLEAHALPLVPSFVFYDELSAMKWIQSTTWPKVFKLRGGAGAKNVRLVESQQKAARLVRRAFSSGFAPRSKCSVIDEAIWRYKRDGGLLNFLRIIKCFALIANHPALKSLLPIQKGYVYFQDYIAENQFDNRFVVIGNRCFCIKRYCRTDDFRASGSGVKSYDISQFPEESIRLAFDVAFQLKTQSCAMDIVYTGDGRPKILEISYGFVSGPSYEDCHGYYSSDLNWHDKPVTPQKFMIEDFVSKLKG